MPTVPPKTPRNKNICASVTGTTPEVQRSIPNVTTMLGMPPMMLEMNRAEVMTRERSWGFGEIAAESPQNGISPMV